MAVLSHVYNSKFWKPDNRYFFQLILNNFAYNYKKKEKKSMDFLVWVGKRRSALCIGLKYKLYNKKDPSVVQPCPKW